jgi:hypothetical protein
MTIIIEKHNNILVLRDDLLPGGTKSIFMDHILDSKQSEYVYASPVYGAAQLALASYCQSVGKKATIFCAKRKQLYPNTQRCIELGANVQQIPYGYLNVVQSRAKKYSEENDCQLLAFGFDTPVSRSLIAQRTEQVIKHLGYEPKEIWCALGSGVLTEGILAGTKHCEIKAVQVGKEYTNKHPRLEVIEYTKSFEKVSTYPSDFPSTANYDLKAWEICNERASGDKVLFWNVF